MAWQFAERMNGIRFLLGSEKGDGSWYDLAAKWLEDGLQSGGFRREAMPRAQLVMALSCVG